MDFNLTVRTIIGKIKTQLPFKWTKKFFVIKWKLWSLLDLSSLVFPAHISPRRPHNLNARGSGGPPATSLIFRPNCGPKGGKNFFRRTPPPPPTPHISRSVSVTGLWECNYAVCLVCCRDVMWQGTTDDGCVALADLLGWKVWHYQINTSPLRPVAQSNLTLDWSL